MKGRRGQNKISGCPFIKLENITVRLREKLFFAHTDWMMEKGQHWGIVGSNGSGKSLFSGIISHKCTICEGQAHYYFNDNKGEPFFSRGDIITVSPDAQRETMQRYGGYHQARWQSFEGAEVPTVSAFLTGKSIEHVSSYDVTALMTDESTYLERRRKAVELMKIENLLERKIHQLSNGETRKMLLARALMQAPKLLILDDPFGGLDDTSRRHLMEAVEVMLGSFDIHILIATSRYEEIPNGITHVIMVENSRIVRQGPKDQILRNKKPLADLAQEADEFSAYSRLPEWKSDSQFSRNALVEMKDVNISYHDVNVLSGINWTVKADEHWAVLGANGAGKTSLLSLILADNPQAYSNEIVLFGQKRGSGESIWDIKRNIGWVSPELQMFYQTNRTCLDTVCSGFMDSMGLFRSCSAEQKKRAMDWLRFLSVHQLAYELFDTVSVGQQRMVLLARALVKSPRLLVLDEPCQGLDILCRERIISLLDRLCAEAPVNLIYVTHHTEELPNAINRRLILERGRIRETV